VGGYSHLASRRKAYSNNYQEATRVFEALFMLKIPSNEIDRFSRLWEKLNDEAV